MLSSLAWTNRMADFDFHGHVINIVRFLNISTLDFGSFE